MIAITDVYYGDEGAVAACVLADWFDDTPAGEFVATLDEVSAYESGKFYLRELPGLLAVLANGDIAVDALDAVVVDGYVWLDREGRRGLGAHLYEALDERVPVIGVAKNPFGDADFAVEVLRGDSSRPLFVTTVDFDVEEAARRVGEMKGRHRIPTLMRLVDHICRQLRQ